MKLTVAAALASLQMQQDNIIERSQDPDMRAHWLDQLQRCKANRAQIARDFLPSGSGIDTGTTIERVSDERIVMSCSFHHMDENGYYDGWTDHTIRVTCGLYLGLKVHVTGQNRNDVKDHLAEVYRHALGTMIEWSIEKSRYVRVSDDT